MSADANLSTHELKDRTELQLISENDELRRQVAALKDALGTMSDGAAARAADNKFQKLVEGSIQGIIVVGLPDWRPLFVNEAVAGMYGYGSAEEMMRLESLEVIVHPDDRPNMKRQDEIFKTNKEHFFNEFRGVRKDGSIINIYDMVTPIAWNGEMALLATSIDISDKKQAEQELQDSEERLRLITDTLPAFIAYIDAEGYYRFANKFYEDWFDRPIDTIIGHHIEDVIGSDNFAAISESYHRVLGGKSSTGFVEIKSGDGRKAHFFAQFMPDRAPDGTIRGYYVLSQDTTEMKRAEEELRISEKRLKAAQRIGHIGNWEHIFNADHYTEDALFWSDETYRIFGLDPEHDSATAELFFSIVHPDDRALNMAAFDDAITGNGVFHCDHRIVLPDGEIRFVQERGEIVCDDSGRPLRSYGTVQDITKARLAEDVLRESEQNFRGIMNNIADCVVTIDEAGTILSFNKAAENSFGYSAEEIIGAKVEQLMPSSHAARHQHYVGSYLASGRSAILGKGPRELVGLRKDGSTFSLELTISEMHIAGRRTFIGAMRDITERKSAERSLRESEGKLLEAQRIAGLGNWSWDIATNDLEWSDGLYRVFGREPGEFKGTYPAFLEAIHPDDRKRVDSAVRRTLEDGEPYGIDHRVVWPDGSVHMLYERGEVTFDESGNALRMSGTAQDITERKQMEEQLQQSQKMEAVGQLTGGIAHDFNNLLTVIVGNLELAEDELVPGSAIAEMIERSLAAANRGAELTDRLLSFSRKQSLFPAPLDLNSMVTNMTQILHRTLGETIEVKNRKAEDLWLCQADQSQLENALLNLSINARDAMQSGGSLTIKTANISLDASSTTLDTDIDPGEYVVLSVSDTGSGIAKEALPHVFEPFFTTKDVGKGTGLGLSMVHGFAKQSRGTVSIDSAPGKGTTINLYLPRTLE